MPLYRSLAFAALLLGACLVWAGAACAQSPDVTGNWEMRRPFGMFEMVLQQNGDRVTGSYHLGKLQGTLQGNVLIGSYSDIMSSGGLRLVFGPNGTLQGSAGGGNGGETWTGRRLTTAVVTPATILAQRARLASVFQPGGDYAAQAAQACSNAFQASYTELPGGWATIEHRGNGGGFAQPLGAPQDATQWEQIMGVRQTEVTSQPLSQADHLNGWAFKGLVGFTGSSARLSFNGQWQDWQTLPRVAFVTCRYIVRNGQPAFEAFDGNLGVSLDRLTKPAGH